jgi:hypothetical protein
MELSLRNHSEYENKRIDIAPTSNFSRKTEANDYAARTAHE